MPVTFDIYPEFIETKMHRVDTIDRAYEEKLMEEKWSRNKTLQRYKKKINSFSELESTICKLNGAFGYRALQEGLKQGETGVFLETAHPAKFLETVESIIGEAVEIPAKLQEFMKGEKKSLQMTKEFADFKKYLLSV